MKKTFTMFLIIVLAFSLVACSSKEEPTNESNDNIIEENGDNDIIDKVEEDDTEEKNQVVEPTPKTDSEEVILYFANNEYINTGDESLEKLIPEKKNCGIWGGYILRRSHCKRTDERAKKRQFKYCDTYKYKIVGSRSI